VAQTQATAELKTPLSHLSYEPHYHYPTQDDIMLDLHYWPTPNGKKVTIQL